MIEINYVHSTADQPDIYLKDHTEDGIGMYGDPKGPITAEFLGLVKYNGQDYLLGRTTLAFNHDSNYEGKITARHAMVNKTEQGIDKDIFIDMEEDEYTKNIEEQLSTIDKEERITNLSLLNMSNNLGLEVLPYGSMIQDGKVTAIGIKHQPYAYIEMCRKTEEEEKEEIGKIH